MDLAGTGKYMERIKFYLPQYTCSYQKYNANSKEGCIVLPLFQGWNSINPEYHINSAFWVYHSFIVNSNIADVGIPIIFYVEDKVWAYHDIKEMFKQANIPEHKVWTFTKTPTKTVYRYYLGLKLSCLWDKRFDDFKNVLVWDTDLFVSCRTNKKLDVLSLFKREKPTQPAALHVKPNDTKPFRFHETHDTRGHLAKELASTITLDLIGKEYEGGYSIGGCIHSFCPGQIKSEFVDFYRRALPLIGDDEMIVSLWSMAYNEEIEELDPILPSIVYTADHLKNHNDKGDVFLCHLWSQSIETGADVENWKQCIGLRKRAGLSYTHLTPILFPDPAPDIWCVPDILVLNLGRRADRLTAFKKALYDAGYRNTLYVVKATDMQDFDSYDALTRFAMSSYPSFKVFLKTEVPWLPYQLSLLRCLEWISERSNHVLLFEDDTSFRCPWQGFLELFNQLPQNFNIAMLNYNHAIDRQRSTSNYTLGWDRGAKSHGTTSNVYSPYGAKILHDTIQETPEMSAEMHLLNLDSLGGVFSAVPVLAGTMPDFLNDSDVTPEHSRIKT